MVRRRQLLRVAAALADRLNLGYAAFGRMRRGARERQLLTAHAHSMIHAGAERVTRRGGEARGLPQPAARRAATRAIVMQVAAGGATEARLTSSEASLLARWRSVARLKSVPATNGTPRVATATAADTASSYISALRVLHLEHGIGHGYWLLKCTVGNTGRRQCTNLAASALHPCPSCALRAEVSVTPQVRPSEQTILIIAVPVASIIAYRAIDIDLLLTWRAPCGALHAAGADAVGVAGGAADEAAAFCGQGVDVWHWQHCIGTRVSFDSGCLLTRRSVRPSCALPLPSGLTCSITLVSDAPNCTSTSSGNSSSALLGLSSVIMKVLGMQRIEPFGSCITAVSGVITGGGCGCGALDHGARAPMTLAPVATRLVTYRRGGGDASIGDGGGGSALVEVRVGGTGRWAELRLTASGAAHVAILSSAAGALRAVLSPATKLEVNLASATVIHCLGRAILTLQAELMSATKDCGIFLTAADGARGEPGEANAVEALPIPMRVAALQSATDAQMSALHSLLLL